jgi:hypothetical protein
MTLINLTFPMWLTYTQLILIYVLLAIQKKLCKHFTHNFMNSSILDYSHSYINYISQFTHIFFINDEHNKNETSSILGAKCVTSELHVITFSNEQNNTRKSNVELAACYITRWWWRCKHHTRWRWIIKKPFWLPWIELHKHLIRCTRQGIYSSCELSHPVTIKAHLKHFIEAKSQVDSKLFSSSKCPSHNVMLFLLQWWKCNTHL